MTLMQELLTILEEAEFLFGPRDRSYELLEPEIYERPFAQAFFYGGRKVRIYLTNHCKTDPYAVTYELAHEAIHLLSPVHHGEATVLEEGLATFFAGRYAYRIHGVERETNEPRYHAAMCAVAPLLGRNVLAIKELRARQPVISKIDERLLVEVAGVEPHHARFLCSDFESYGRSRRRSEQTGLSAHRLMKWLFLDW